MAVRDLAFDPEVGIGGLDVLAEVGDQGADAPGRGGAAWAGFEVRGWRFQGLGKRGSASALGRGGCEPETGQGSLLAIAFRLLRHIA